MHEKSTFADQLAEYKVMPKLTKLLHRTLFWIEMNNSYRAKMIEALNTALKTDVIMYKLHQSVLSVVIEERLSFCTARLKQAQRDLMNLLIGIEQINNIVS